MNFCNIIPEKCIILNVLFSIFIFFIHSLINAQLSDVFKHNFSSTQLFMLWIIWTIFTISEAITIDKCFITIGASPELKVRRYFDLTLESPVLIPKVLHEIHTCSTGRWIKYIIFYSVIWMSHIECSE